MSVCPGLSPVYPPVSPTNCFSFGLTPRFDVAGQEASGAERALKDIGGFDSSPERGIDRAGPEEPE
jgi:hypothetical protein